LLRPRLVVLLVLALSLLFATRASAAQGVAVLGTSGARDDAFALARAVYVPSLRPRSLDEVRARVLAGDPAPGVATKEVKDLADLRAAVNGEDAASRQILSGIAKQLGVQALLVVSKTSTSTPPVDADAGDADAAVSAGTRVQARLFVAEDGTKPGEFDAARYEFDGSWEATVASVSARFPQTSPPPAPSPVVAGPSLLKVPPKKEEDRPFYKSPWLWGAVAAAVLIGGIFFFATQDNGDDPIHVRMNVPR
jgi:hypothetical protein